MFGLLRAFLGAQVVSAQVSRVRREAHLALVKTALGIVAAVLALVAVGFFTAAGHLSLERALGPVTASLIVGGVYLVIALIVWAVMATRDSRPQLPAETPDLAATARTTLFSIGQSVGDAARSIDPKAIANAGGRKLARTVGPLTLASIAIVAGYLAARRIDR
ncbi:phage holin family protein [Pseudochelatococcus contaminans]|uniref:Drug/metabolite transporter (DMT)-like permease n=1 Tax=Pseudochelatococcus contaminans TaxID=1538103 RepID=A0A7W5Z442_9HYPH|nr:phage holin family protein [Pseudochelatococcus contaminans]MBB3809798.1 drug/metabolite transporter (DMT)-like permease [Pseudochelatococcus contaminans]